MEAGTSACQPLECRGSHGSQQGSLPGLVWRACAREREGGKARKEQFAPVSALGSPLWAGFGAHNALPQEKKVVCLPVLPLESRPSAKNGIPPASDSLLCPRIITNIQPCAI